MNSEIERLGSLVVVAVMILVMWIAASTIVVLTHIDNKSDQIIQQCGGSKR